MGGWDQYIINFLKFVRYQNIDLVFCMDFAWVTFQHFLAYSLANLNWHNLKSTVHYSKLAYLFSYPYVLTFHHQMMFSYFMSNDIKYFWKSYKIFRKILRWETWTFTFLEISREARFLSWYITLHDLVSNSNLFNSHDLQLLFQNWY